MTDWDQFSALSAGTHNTVMVRVFPLPPDSDNEIDFEFELREEYPAFLLETGTQARILSSAITTQP